MALGSSVLEQNVTFRLESRTSSNNWKLLGADLLAQDQRCELKVTGTCTSVGLIIYLTTTQVTIPSGLGPCSTEEHEIEIRGLADAIYLQ